jgi:hypothetical protein
MYNIEAGEALAGMWRARSSEERAGMITTALTSLLKQAHEIALMERIRNEESELFRDFWRIWKTLSRDEFERLFEVARRMKAKPAAKDGGSG